MVRRLPTWSLAATLMVACAGQSPDPASPSTTRAQDGDAAEVEDPVVILPLRQLPTHHIVVPVSVRGATPVDFILDTGASMSVITPTTRDVLGFTADDGMVAQGRGAGGDMAEVRILVLDRMSVGERSYADHTVAVTDLSHLEDKLESPIGGILGANFLDKHVIEIDFTGEELRLHPADAVESGGVPTTDMGQVEYVLFETGGLIRLEVKLDGNQPMAAVLDLGAGRSVMNWKAAGIAGVTPKSKGLRRVDQPLMGADSKPIETAGFTFQSVEVGESRFDRPEIFMADLPVFQTLGIHEQPAMIFGVDMFRGRRIVLDYGRHRLYVSPPTGTAVIQGRAPRGTLAVRDAVACVGCSGFAR